MDDLIYSDNEAVYEELKALCVDPSIPKEEIIEKIEDAYVTCKLGTMRYHELLYYCK